MGKATAIGGRVEEIRGLSLWSNNYHLYSTSFESPVDGLAYMAQTVWEKHLISDGLQIYYEGFFPYAHYMALLTTHQTEKSASQLQAFRNPYLPGNPINESLGLRKYKFVLLHPDDKPYDSDPVYMQNQLHFARDTDTSLWYTVYDAFRYFPTGIDPMLSPLPYITKVVTHPTEIISFSNTSRPFFQSLIRTGLYADSFVDPSCPSLANIVQREPWRPLLGKEYINHPSKLFWSMICSGYLIASLPRDPSLEVVLNRIKLPRILSLSGNASTAFPTNQTYPSFSDYDLAYWSISIYGPQRMTDFTIEGKDLAPFQDENGFVIVFVLPLALCSRIPDCRPLHEPSFPAFEDIQPLTKTRQLWKLKWGKYEGLVLPYPEPFDNVWPLNMHPFLEEFFFQVEFPLPPSFMLIRQKGPTPTFQIEGFAKEKDFCETSPDDSHPPCDVSNEDHSMQDYIPTSFMDTVPRFLDGFIGPIASHKSWDI
jgi:hypothetical protein